MKESFEIKPSILENENIKRLIKSRDISKDDFELLEQFSTFPQKLFINYHNYFNNLKERSIEELQNDLKNEKDFNKKEFLNLLLEFTEKYDWTASYNLIRTFEKIN